MALKGLVDFRLAFVSNEYCMAPPLVITLMVQNMPGEAAFIALANVASLCVELSSVRLQW